MVVSVDTVARRYEDITTAPIAVDIPAFEAADIYVYYGSTSELAVQGVDYTVLINLDFLTFIITPTTSLTDKIDALIAADPTETNFITVRRRLDLLTDATAPSVRNTQFTSDELDRTAMRFQQLEERLNRAIVLAERFVGDAPQLQLDAVLANTALVFNDDATAIVPGPSISAIAYANAIGATTGGYWITDAATLFTDDTFSPVESSDKVTVAAGSRIQTRSGEGDFIAVDSGEHFTTPGGMKLRAVPNALGRYSAVALKLCSGADAASQIVALSNLGVTHIDIPRGETITLNTTATITNAANFSIGGEGTLDCSGGGGLDVLGSHVALPALSGTYARGARTVTFASAHGLAVGDCVVVWDDTDFSAGLSRDYYKQGFRMIVAVINSATAVTFYGRIPIAVTNPAFYDVAKVVGGDFEMKAGLNIIANSGEIAPVRVIRRRHVRIDAPLTPEGSGYVNMNITQCYDAHVRDLRGTAMVSDAYPLVVSSCQVVLLENVTAAFSSRHALSVSGGGLVTGDTEGNTPCREVIATNCILKSSGGYSGDLHGAVFDAVFDTCILDPGLVIGGGDHNVVNCTLHAFDNRCAYMSEIDGGLVQINGCTLITYGSDDGRAAIEVEGVFLRTDLRLEINDNVWEHRGASTDDLRPIIISVHLLGGNWDASSGAYPVGATHGEVFEVTLAGVVDGTMRNLGEYWVYSEYGDAFNLSPKSRIDVSVSNPVVTGVDEFDFLVLIGNQVMDNRFTFALDSLRGEGGSYFVATRAVHQDNCKLRLPQQSIAVAATTATDSPDNIVAPVDFKFAYPRVPNKVNLGWLKSSAGGLTTSETQGRMNVFSYSATTARLWLHRADASNWASAINVVLCGEFGLDNL